jgi:phospholipid transport system substrate-binding protein
MYRRLEMVSELIRHAWAARLSRLWLLLPLMIGALTQGAVAAADPQGVVRGFYDVLLANMRNGSVLGESGRYARLAPVVDRDFDIPAMTRLAVGVQWATLNPTEQQRLIAAFGHYVAATYADQFDSYSGQQLQVAGERPYGPDMMVQTKIIKSNGDSTRLDYLMDQGGRILDVYLDGSISELAVHHSEFHSILQRDGVDGLVMALNRKVDLLANVAKAS